MYVTYVKKSLIINIQDTIKCAIIVITLINFLAQHIQNVTGKEQ